MVDLLLWNSIAKRRRSISDTFYDNGLGTIKGYLEEKGFTVEIIDWARDDFFSMLSGNVLSGWLRGLYGVLVTMKNPFAKGLLGFLSLQLQELLNFLQAQRLDCQMQQLARYIRDNQIRVFGIKVWYGEAFTNAKRLVHLVRAISPQTIIIAGGYHVTLYEEHLMQQSDFDFGVVCEGEFALEQILKVASSYADRWQTPNVIDEIVALAERDEIHNLIYRKAGAIRKSSRRKVTAYSSKSIPRYNLNPNKVRIHVMVESLGCDWGKCHFCVHSQFYPHYALREAGEIVREIKAMREKGIGVFRFAGSDTPPAYGAKIAQEIRRQDLKVTFGMGSRPIKGAREQQGYLISCYRMLIEAGLKAVFMGGETGNDLINDEVMNKGVTADDILATVESLREAEKQAGAKVYLSLALIYPAPLLGKVTLETLKSDNIRLLQQARPDSVMITPPGPFLHTKWYEERDRFAFKVYGNIITQAMEYEYVLYKPPELWPKLDICLEGRPFKQLLRECNELRTIVEKELEIPTDISDEHALMFYAAGIRDKEAIAQAKRETMLDIVSCNYKVTHDIAERVNAFSQL